MTLFIRQCWLTLLVGGLLLSTSSQAQEGCLNNNQFPSLAAVPNPDGTVTQVSTCVYAQEYTAFTGLIPGATYEFTVSGGNYMTVRSGTFDGPVVAAGVSPLQYEAATADDLYVHYTVDENCVTAAGCLVNTIQLLLNCDPVQATFAIELDCENNAYFVVVDVTSIGDATSVDIENDANAPAIEGVGVGTYQVGPIQELTPVQVFVRHNEDVACSLLSPVLVNDPCPVVGCGPDTYTYCHGNNENLLFFYESGNEQPIAILFSGGQMDEFGDVITIFNGPDVDSPIIFQGSNGGDMTDVLAISNNPSNALTVRLTTNFSNSCQDIGYQELSWDVQCLECVQPEATYEVVQDCDNFQFFVDVVITDLGDSPTITINNDGGVAPLEVDAAGTYQVGPFVSGVPVVITLEYPADELCNVTSGVLENPLCPQPIVCGAPATEDDYCYGPGEDRAWSYLADGSGILRLTFLRGTIESSSFDRITIYDGPDATAPILFEHTLFGTWNLGPQGSAVNNALVDFYGVDVFSTTGALYMTLTSDGSGQCSSSTIYDPWEWEVVCLDCELPVVGAGIEEDCGSNSFLVNVTVGSTGDGASVNVVYTVNGGAPEVIEGVGTGQVDLGPFAINDIINVVVEHESNPLCNVDLGDITDSGTCPTIIVCGEELNEVYCEGNGENTFFYYQGDGEFPLALFFNSGFLETCCDRLRVYDGPDDTAPELTPAGGAAGDLTGLFFFASNPENQLTVRITTDGSVSCQSGSSVQLDWTLSCLDCAPPVATFEIVQDCENFQYFVDVVITDLGTDDVVELVYNDGADTLDIAMTGTYQVGPFVSGTESAFTLVNDANSLCNVSSGTLVNPLCPVILCGAEEFEETYCYEASEDRAWAYELPGNGTLRLTFLRGTIESNTFDRITIYDGPDASSDTLFFHDNTATWNLGPEGSAVNNTIANFYAVDVTATGSNLYMTLTSDGSVQCATSTTYDPWEWIVFCEGCELPGVVYNAVPNCFDRTYVMDVEVSNVGPDGLRVLNTFTNEEQVLSAAGTAAFGPFPQDSPVAFELTALDNPSCSYFSDTLTYASEDCIIRSCGTDNYSHCYGNDEDRWYTFGAPINVPVTISFLEGQMLSGDRIVVYNGPNENSPVIYQGNNGGNLFGFAVNSQNAANLITLRIQSNGDGSCEDGGVSTALRWDVACGAVGIDEQANGVFNVFPNPTTGMVNIDLGTEALGNVVLKVFDLSGRTVHEEQFAAQGGQHELDLNGLVSGQYLIQVSTRDVVRTRQVQVMR